jgi:hypothetical protein
MNVTQMESRYESFCHYLCADCGVYLLLSVGHIDSGIMSHDKNSIYLT